MPEPFPIEIAGTRFASADELAADIARRGDERIIPERGLDPWDWYSRWMREDETGTTTAAVLAACALLIDSDTSSGDALHHAIELSGSKSSAVTLRRLMDRIAVCDIPASRWYGDRDAITLAALESIRYGVQTKLPSQVGRLAWMFETLGEFYAASSVLLSGGLPDPAVVQLVQRWALSSDVLPQEASALGSTATFYPDLVVPLASALSSAADEAKAEFQSQVDGHLPEKSGAVAEALRG